MNSTYNTILSTEQSTVVTEYVPEIKRSDAYQSEAALENAFIKMLGEQGYEYVKIHNSDSLVSNLKEQLEKLNDYKFTNSEWERFFNNSIANQNEGIEEKCEKIQEENVQVLKRDDGSTKNITLIDKKNIHNNYVQVINQYENDEGNRDNRYDVTILVNGLPLVHVELKRRGVALKEAFNQINRYQRDSFWAGSGLYEYVQIFVISNGTHTKYYSNSTRANAIKEHGQSKGKKKKTSNSYEFTSYWADARNKVIMDLVDFTKTFFDRHTLLSILTRFCVFTSDKTLLVMRPYQIAASEKIINRIEIANNYKKQGSIEAGGYIWHTTGSGKTLTSFKTARLASNLPFIDKVIFIVDRKDLDYQTMKEYDRFEKDAANSNASTRILTRQLEDKDEKGNPHTYRIIITTIQKMHQFVKSNNSHPAFEKNCVMIFDECHRGHFGEMHQDIVKKFKNYYIFGFTGTPIFAKNATAGKNPKLKTTEQAFGEKLHTYTIVDAINDENVLPFRVDYIDTVKGKDGLKDKLVKAIDIERALMAPERIREVVRYILEHFDQKTKRSDKSYAFRKLLNIEEVAKDNRVKELKDEKHLKGFNSILAVSSIEAAKKYYVEFKKQMEEKPEQKLRVALIYSYGVNEDDPDGFIEDENSDDTEGLDKDSRSFLDDAIKDYNEYFGTAYDTSAAKFPNYYKDLSLRVKNKEVDLLIVVSMFLTGFDSTTLNTLWVDKNLKMHGLIQAFSRTNRILNSIKTFGNIVCFRNLQKETDEAIALFGDRDAKGIVLLKSYDDYYYGYIDEDGKKVKGYEERIAELIQKYPLKEQIVGETAEKDFIKLFGKILRLQNILSSFDGFEGNEILSDIDFQDYMGTYQDMYDKYRKQEEKDNINDDIVFEMELVKQVEVNIDYILMLVEKYHKKNCEDKEVLVEIEKAIGSSSQLRSKKELIQQFIASINVNSNVSSDWIEFVKKQKEQDLEEMIEENNLNPVETRKFVNNSLRDGFIKTTGTDIPKLMPPVPLFGKVDRAQLKQSIIEKLQAFFDKYFGLGIEDSKDEAKYVVPKPDLDMVAEEDEKS